MGRIEVLKSDYQRAEINRWLSVVPDDYERIHYGSPRYVFYVLAIIALVSGTYRISDPTITLGPLDILVGIGVIFIILLYSIPFKEVRWIEKEGVFVFVKRDFLYRFSLEMIYYPEDGDTIKRNKKTETFRSSDSDGFSTTKMETTYWVSIDSSEGESIQEIYWIIPLFPVPTMKPVTKIRDFLLKYS
jgi:hypothetical protein